MKLHPSKTAGAIATLALLLILVSFANVIIGDAFQQNPASQAALPKTEMESSWQVISGTNNNEPRTKIPETGDKKPNDINKTAINNSAEQSEEKSRLAHAKFVDNAQLLLVNHQVSDIERLVDITEDQRRRLMALMVGGLRYRSTISDQLRFHELKTEEEEEIKAILGEEAGKIYQEEKDRKAERNRREWLSNKILRFSGELALSAEQLQSIEGLISETQQELKYTGENYMDQTLAALRRKEAVNSPPEATSALQAQTLADFNSRLKEILTGEQYRDLLHLQTGRMRQ